MVPPVAMVFNNAPHGAIELTTFPHDGFDSFPCCKQCRQFSLFSQCPPWHDGINGTSRGNGINRSPCGTTVLTVLLWQWCQRCPCGDGINRSPMVTALMMLPMVMASKVPLVDSVDGTPCGYGIKGALCANNSKALAMQAAARALPVPMAFWALSVPTVVRG